MDPNYNWSSQAYPNGRYAQYAQPNGYQQPQLQPQYQQQHAHQHQHQPGYPQAYPQQYSQNVSLQPSSGYAPPQLFHGHPQAPPLHQASQHYPGMIQPMPQQIQMNRHQQVPMNHQQQVDIGYQQQMQINHQQQMQVNHQQQMQVNHQRQMQVSHQQQRQTNNHQQPNFRQQESPKTNQQPQINRQQQQKPRAQPQVVVPARTPNPATYIQVQPPQIQQNETQDPLQRAGNEKNLQPSSTTPAAKPLAKTQLHQENKPRPQQRPSNTPIQKHSQYRAPLQPHSVPHQPASSQKQTPVKQHRSPSLQDPSPRPKSHPKVVITKPTSHQLTPTKHAHTQRQQLPADLSVMLLSAADEYITAARSMSVATMRDKKYANRQQYQQLMATAMGCMDTVLKDFNLQPRDEAKLRLRYASLLIEETDNATDIEEILSKQISLCGRFRLHDLKYATFHLQARYQSKTNHRAAIKSLGKPISEAETFQHIAWVYALRFLKVSLTLQAPGRIEAIPALQQLNSILAHAQKHGDRAIYVACYALEAMVHLRSIATDRLEQAQRSIAAARSLQLELSEAQLGSFGTLIDLIDIACGVQQGAPNHTKQSALDKIMTDKSEKSDNVNAGICTVLIEKSFGGSLTSDTGGIFQRSVDGRDELVFSWLPREDMQALCFYISALDQSVHEKGSRFIEEAHSRSRESLKCQPMHCIPVCVAQSRADWLRLLNWYNVFTYGLISLSRNNQSRAKEALSSLKGQIRQHPYNNQDSFVRTLSYLSAVVDQSDGRLDSALRTYSSKELALQESTPAAGCKTDISILSAMNRFLIVRDPAHVEHHTANALLAILQPVSTNHPNQYIRTAYRILQGITSDNVTINRQKTQMQMASNQARDVFTATNNVEFVIMALSIFTSRFFVDASNWAQAMNATRRIAMKSGKPLWIAVASGLCIMAYQRNGLLDDAQKAQADYELVRPKLPAPLRGEPEDIDVKGEDEEI